jgi:hypothetical protein
VAFFARVTSEEFVSLSGTSKSTLPHPVVHSTLSRQLKSAAHLPRIRVVDYVLSMFRDRGARTVGLMEKVFERLFPH